ncbi:MAG: DHH family phosphoesterase [Pseudomonadota bacterium]
MPSRGSKNKPRNMAEQVRRLLALFAPEDRVLVSIAADPDAMGAALAFKRLLWRRVASVTIARANEITRPDNLAMIRLLNIPLEPLNSLRPGDFSKRVMVDSQPHHSKTFAGTPQHVIIDHHPLGEGTDKALFADVRPRYGATSSIMTEYLRAAGIKPSTRLATALVYGIKNDTAGFQRPAIAEDVAALQFLFPKANQAVLRNIEFSEMRLKDLEVLRQALGLYQVRRHCIFVHLGACQSPDNLVQIADFFLKVDSVDFTAASGIYRDNLVVVMRNVGLRTNAGALAQRAFGDIGPAGGHKAMARAELPVAVLKERLGKLDEAKLRDFVMQSLLRPAAAKR